MADWTWSSVVTQVCHTVALGAPSPCFSQRFPGRMISHWLRSWQLRTAMCLWEKMGSCLAQSTNSCFSKELFHPLPHSVYAAVQKCWDWNSSPQILFSVARTVSLNLQKQYWSWSYFYVSPASLLKHLKHANIVLLHDIIQTKETLTFVLEYMVSYSFFWLPVKLVLGSTGKTSGCIMNLLHYETLAKKQIAFL